jgi:hypothetical protein
VPNPEHCSAFLLNDCNESMITVTIDIIALITTGLPINKTDILANTHTYYHYINREGKETADHTHKFKNEE